MPGYAVVTYQAVGFQMPNELVVIVDIHRIAKNEGDVDALASVLSVDHQAPLELHLQKRLAVDVTGNEVRTLPVIRQPQAIKSEVRHARGNLVEVVVFLLARIQCRIGDGVKLLHAAPFLVILV